MPLAPALGVADELAVAAPLTLAVWLEATSGSDAELDWLGVEPGLPVAICEADLLPVPLELSVGPCVVLEVPLALVVCTCVALGVPLELCVEVPA